MNRRVRVAALVLALVSLARPSHAYFEELAIGARQLALGFGSIAAVRDPSAYYWNPAALTRLRQLEGTADYAKPYGLSDVNVGAVSFAAPVGAFAVGAGWHHLGLSSSYAEDVATLAVARRVPGLPPRHALSAGAALKYARVGFQPFADPLGGPAIDYGSQARTSADFSLLWETPWRVDLAWVGRDLNEPHYEFIAGSGGQALIARQELGAAIRWNRESTITLGWSQLDAGRTSLSAGIEVTFFEVFAIRSSISNLARIYDSLGSPTELDFNGGIGVFHKGYHVDATATTDHDLGASYRISLRAPLLGGPR